MLSSKRRELLELGSGTNSDRYVTLALTCIILGYRMLRQGGALVYSTCSFARRQNEDVVQAFLQSQPTAYLVPVQSLQNAPWREGSLPHTLRFDPKTSNTSGLFIAKIGKRSKFPPVVAAVTEVQEAKLQSLE